MSIMGGEENARGIKRGRDANSISIKKESMN